MAAVADASPEFAGSCGRCYEVQCAQRAFTDGYGNAIDRRGSDVCSAPGKSLIVRATDNCEWAGVMSGPGPGAQSTRSAPQTASLPDLRPPSRPGPCEYAGNPYSNKRWCCYDSGTTHFDLR